MQSHERGRPGFTLVELLVVIAIIVLLLSVLFPFLGRARDLGRRAVCQTNLRTIAAATYTFAAAHDGRAPGYCTGYRGAEARGRTWVQHLNVEVYGQKRYWQYNQGTVIQSMGPEPQKGRVYCPSIRFHQYLYPRAYRMNLNAAGGPTWGSNPPQGPYGVMVTPPPAPIGDDLVPYWDYYSLGALLERFPNPTEQFLYVESEYGNHYGQSVWPADPPHRAVLGDNPYYPPYSGPNGAFAFRHVLPPSVSLYQSQATANFAYIDGHVKWLTPNSKVNATDRFNYK